MEYSETGHSHDAYAPSSAIHNPKESPIRQGHASQTNAFGPWVCSLAMNLLRSLIVFFLFFSNFTADVAVRIFLKSENASFTHTADISLTLHVTGKSKPNNYERGILEKKGIQKILF